MVGKKRGVISPLDHLAGLLEVRVVRGVDLAIRDLRSSDPYVVLRIGKAQVRFSSPPFWFALLLVGFIGKRSGELKSAAPLRQPRATAPTPRHCAKSPPRIEEGEEPVEAPVVAAGARAGAP